MQKFIVKPLVPFVSGALLMLALAGCSPSNNTNNAVSENTTAMAPNEATDNSAVSSTDATPTVTERASLVSNVWVPGKDDKLHLKPVSKAALDAQKKFGDPTAALADIIKMAPKYFPAKTRVLDYHDNGKSVSVNLSRDFEKSDFWSQGGELKVRLAVYALVNTASTASGTAKPVVLKTDNRPLSTLGELDVSDEIEPDPKLQATSSGSDSSGSEAGGA
ncbi:hypothetical protein IAD21_04656 [Abditibacteriota bacterium]|nr:hypothetical protein IAD21_04656 [Abditibacteriota bacterium]